MGAALLAVRDKETVRQEASRRRQLLMKPRSVRSYTEFVGETLDGPESRLRSRELSVFSTAAPGRCCSFPSRAPRPALPSQPATPSAAGFRGPAPTPRPSD